MPATQRELMDFANGLLEGCFMPDTVPIWSDGTEATREEIDDALRLVAYIATYRYNRKLRRKRSGPRMVAMRLLKRFLTPEQQEQLRRCREFYVHLPSGRSYRFIPGTGHVDEVDRHGKRYYALSSLCIHPDDHFDLPPADVTLGQLLDLLADEDDFRSRANFTDRRDRGMWDGDYLRRMREARMERAGAINELIPEMVPDAVLCEVLG